MSRPPTRPTSGAGRPGARAPLALGRRGAGGLPTRPAAPLGLSDGRDWPGTQIRLAGSWSILLYTDGLIEGRIGKGSERLGRQALMDLIRGPRGGPDPPPGGLPDNGHVPLPPPTAGGPQ